MTDTVLLDMDGTIIDSGPGIMRCINHTLVHYGMPEAPLEVLRKCVGPPLSETFGKRFGFGDDRVFEAIQVYRAEYNAGGIFECDLYPGIKECIKTLHDEGYAVVVTSSKYDAACRRIVEHFELDDYFYDVVGSTGDTKRETKTEVLEAFFEMHPDKKKENAVLIGDTGYDAEGAKNAGIRFVAVTYGYGTRESLEKTDAIALLDSADEIFGIIKSL